MSYFWHSGDATLSARVLESQKLKMAR